RIVFVSAAEASGANRIDKIVRGSAMAERIKKRPTLNAERPISNSDSEFNIERWELDVGRFPRIGLTLQPSTFFYGQLRNQRFRAHRTQRPPRYDTKTSPAGPRHQRSHRHAYSGAFAQMGFVARQLLRRDRLR